MYFVLYTVHNIVHTLEFLRVFSFYDVREVETGKNNKRFTVKTRDYIGRKRTTTGYGPASIYMHIIDVKLYTTIQCVVCMYIIQSDSPSVITHLSTQHLLMFLFKL